MFLAQMDTVKCYLSPQKGASVVPWDSWLPAKPSLRNRHPDEELHEEDEVAEVICLQPTVGPGDGHACAGV